jgi:hypothetical protein
VEIERSQPQREEQHFTVDGLKSTQQEVGTSYMYMRRG